MSKQSAAAATSNGGVSSLSLSSLSTRPPSDVIALWKKVGNDLLLQTKGKWIGDGVSLVCAVYV